MLKPLPYPESEQLDRIDRATAQNPTGRVSPADFLDLQREMQELRRDRRLYARRHQPLRTGPAGRDGASSACHDELLLRPARPTASSVATSSRAEGIPGNNRVVILSQRCWQNRFGGKGDIIGHTLRVDGEPHEIIGVLPAWMNDWRHFGPFDFFRPLALDQQKAVRPSHNDASTHRPPFGRALHRRTPPPSSANFGARLAADFPEVNARKPPGASSRSTRPSWRRVVARCWPC